jgi:hypothetical protein
MRLQHRCLSFLRRKRFSRQPEHRIGYWNTVVIDQIERIDTAFAIASVKLSYGKNSQDRARCNGVGRSSCAGSPQNRNRAPQTAPVRSQNAGRDGGIGCGNVFASTGGNCGVGLLVLGGARLSGRLPRRRLVPRGAGTSSTRAVGSGPGASRRKRSAFTRAGTLHAKECVRHWLHRYFRSTASKRP